jgi:hypothetical protein
MFFKIATGKTTKTTTWQQTKAPAKNKSLPA